MRFGRREFLKASALATAAASLPIAATAKVVNGIPYRRLGKTNEEVSLLGVGGSHIGNKELSDSEAIKIMRAAVDEGVNFFDNAWEYNGGRSEERMGRALQDGYRDKVFLMSKVIARDKANAQRQLDESLRRLKADYLDLWQVHSIGTFEPDDMGKVYSKGVLDAAMKAKDEGKVRHIGFSGHTDPDIHIAVIEGGFDWETVQMPVNCLDPHRKSFVKTVVPIAQQYDLGVIAMKSLAGGGVLKTGAVSAQDALLYAMSMPVSVVVSGMDSFEKFRQNLDVAKTFQQADPSAIATLLARTKPFGEQAQYESYKRNGSSAR